MEELSKDATKVTLPERIELAGFAINRQVWLNEVYLNPEKSQLIRNHSPDGFNWGYSGSGPAQLALAVLLEYVHPTTAQTRYQLFKEHIIAGLGDGSFKVQIKLAEYLHWLWDGMPTPTPETPFERFVVVDELQFEEIKSIPIAKPKQS